MAARVEFNISEYQSFIDRLRQAASGDFKKELILFIENSGSAFLEMVQNAILNLNVVDTRLLLASFHKGGSDGVWELSAGGLTLEVGTNVKYAAFVNDGHWTNPKGVESRFVPGYWSGDRFIYEPGAKTGMVLKQQWVDGTHYWESALRIFEKLFPEMLEAMLQDWFLSYFG